MVFNIAPKYFSYYLSNNFEISQKHYSNRKHLQKRNISLGILKFL